MFLVTYTQYIWHISYFNETVYFECGLIMYLIIGAALLESSLTIHSCKLMVIYIGKVFRGQLGLVNVTFFCSS
jgi:hypothetical protein